MGELSGRWGPSPVPRPPLPRHPAARAGITVVELPARCGTPGTGSAGTGSVGLDSEPPAAFGSGALGRVRRCEAQRVRDGPRLLAGGVRRTTWYHPRRRWPARHRLARGRRLGSGAARRDRPGPGLGPPLEGGRRRVTRTRSSQLSVGGPLAGLRLVAAGRLRSGRHVRARLHPSPARARGRHRFTPPTSSPTPGTPRPHPRRPTGSPPPRPEATGATRTSPGPGSGAHRPTTSYTDREPQPLRDGSVRFVAALVIDVLIDIERCLGCRDPGKQVGS